MEDIVERISSGETITIIIGSNNRSIHTQYMNLITNIQKLYSNIFIIVVNYDTNPLSSSSSSSSSSTSSSSSSSSSWLENNLKLFHLILLQSTLLLLIDVQIQSTAELSQNSIEFSDLSQIILFHLRRENLNTYCLHSSTHVLQEKSSSHDLPTSTSSSTISPSQILLHLSRQYLNDIKMIHLIGDPLEVLKLLSWSLQNFHHLSRNILLTSNHHHHQQQQQLKQSIEIESIDDHCLIFDCHRKDSLYLSLTSIFFPLLEPMTIPPNQTHPISDLSEEEVKNDKESGGNSPRRSGRKRKINYYYSPNSGGGMSEGSDELDGNILTQRPNTTTDDQSKGNSGSSKFRRKPLFPSHELPPRPGSSFPSSSSGMRILYNSNSNSSSHNSSPPQFDDPYLERNDSRSSYHGGGDEVYSQCSIATLADIVEKITSPNIHERSFRHLFTGNHDSLGQRGSIGSSGGAGGGSSNLVRTHSLSQQILDGNDNEESRGTYRDESFGNSFPLSQITIGSTDDFLPESNLDYPDEGDQQQQQGGGGTGGGGRGNQLHRTNTASSTSSTNGTKTNNNPISTATSTSNTLHRKPSFLAPGTHYDGGEFQFMSGLSQE